MNEGAQFDFWLGDWNVTWPDGRGTNRVRKVLDGKVILEEFDGKPDIDLEGMSVSTYDAEQRRWLQTWVDSRGNYMSFVGGLANGVMELRQIERTYRMRWYDIEPNALTWSWERSWDDGRTWETIWMLAYHRRRPPPRLPGSGNPK